MSQAWVIDPSVLIQGYIEDSETNRVQTLLSSVSGENAPELHIPEFCLVECANILWKQVRFHGASVDDARQALSNLAALPLTIHPVVDLLQSALTIGLSHQLPVYDALYIALAQTMRYPLITVDERQEKAAESIGVTLKPLTDFAEFAE
jgi:predicted nucleic acid-binding protein